MSDVTAAASQIKKEFRELLTPLSESLQRIKTLRHSVDTVFTFLHDGCSDDGSDVTTLHHQNFLEHLRNALHSVMKNFDDLEATVNKYPCKAIPTDKVPIMGNMSQVHRDPNEETQSLLHDYHHSLRAYYRTQDFARCAEQLFNNNGRKRTSYPHAHPNAKRSRQGSKVHCPTAEISQQVFSSIMRSYSELKSTLKLLYGNTRVLQIMVGRVMFAHIVLRGLVIERVFVRGLDEEDLHDGIDLVSKSQYQTMQLITDHASASALFYSYSRTHDESLRVFIAWLRSYRNLFNEPCRRCKRHLLRGIPPTWRDFHTLLPYHFDCRH